MNSSEPPITTCQLKDQSLASGSLALTADRLCSQSETEQKKSITGPLVLTLLAISVIVPMLQYYGYTSED